MSSKKGDILEAIVCVVEKAQQTNSATRIFKNHKLPDRHGKMREHDVYVETEVNGKVLKYSFECKAYGNNSKVKMSHIADFYDKLQETGITGIFVSNGTFQKNAIDKAKQLSIDIYAIQDGNPENVPVKDLHLFKKNFRIGRTIVGLEELHFKLVASGKAVIDFIYEGNKKKPIPVKEFFEKRISPFIANEVRNNYAELFKNYFEFGKDGSFKMVGGEIEKRIGLLELFNYYYKIENEYFPLKKIQFEVLLSHDLEKIEQPKHNTFVNLHTGKELLSYSALKSEISGEEFLLNFVKMKNEKLKIATINPHKMDASKISFKKSILLRDVKITYRNET